MADSLTVLRKAGAPGAQREQFARHMRPVAVLIGLPPSALPEAVKKRGGRTPSP